MSADIIHTAFDAAQRQLGGEFMDWEGWLWPNHFGDAVACPLQEMKHELPT